jgi:hypothetical protein
VRTSAEAIVLAAVYVLPLLLALLSLRGRPLLRFAAGVDAIVLAIFPFFVWNLVLLVPGVLLLRSYVRPAAPSGPITATVVALVAVAGSVLTFILPYIHQDPRCIHGESATFCTSDVVTTWEGLMAVTLVVVVAFTLYVLTGSAETSATQSPA